MKIYTRKGDKGTTVLLGNNRVSKDSPQVEAYGGVDELNALLGIGISFSDNREIKSTLTDIQKELFVIGAELSSQRPTSKINLKDVEKLENKIDELEKDLIPLKHFILPGGTKTASLLHHARTVCRRAERKMVTLNKKRRINQNIISYMNRLGDLLFVMARYANRKKRVEETIWKGKKLQ